MLGSMSNKLKKESVKNLNLAIKKAGKLTQLINSKDSGWAEFTAILQDVANNLEKRKALMRLDLIDDAALQEVKYMDREIFVINRILRVPTRYIKALEKELKKVREDEEKAKETTETI